MKWSCCKFFWKMVLTAYIFMAFEAYNFMLPTFDIWACRVLAHHYKDVDDEQQNWLTQWNKVWYFIRVGIEVIYLVGLFIALICFFCFFCYCKNSEEFKNKDSFKLFWKEIFELAFYSLGSHSIFAIFVAFWNLILLILNAIGANSKLICKKDNDCVQILIYQWYELGYYVGRFIIYFAFYGVLKCCGCTKKTWLLIY